MGNAVHKMVFQPPEATYDMDGASSPRKGVPGSGGLSSSKGFFKLRTSRGQTIVARHIDLGHEITVLFSHGNAEEIGGCAEYFEQVFCREVGVNCFLYEYSGYSRSTGFPSEANVYADAEAAYDYLREYCKIRPEQIVLYGRSLGSGPSIHLATKYRVPWRGLVLQSPILSCFRVALPSGFTLPGDMFVNVDKVGAIRCPVMVTHGHDDEIVPFEHGRTLYKKCPAAESFLWLPGAGHNDLERVHGPRLFAAYSRFIHETSRAFDPARVRLQLPVLPKKKAGGPARFSL